MNNHPFANTFLAKGNDFIALGKYEDALNLFLKAIELDPHISVAYKNKEEMEEFIRNGGREILFDSKEISKREQREAVRQRQNAALAQIQNLEARQRQKELARIRRQEEKEDKRYQEEITRHKREKAKAKREEKRKRLALSNILSELIREIEYSANEIPCPRCNELEIMVLSLSPNARSLLARCKHCEYEYRIKIEPDNPQKLVNLFNLFMEGRSSFAETKDTFPIWLMEIRKPQITNQRIPIPSNVKRGVWKRDNGKCVICGSEVELEFDHIIPVSRGGSSTIQNIQILCKKCNRKKHTSIQ